MLLIILCSCLRNQIAPGVIVEDISKTRRTSFSAPCSPNFRHLPTPISSPVSIQFLFAASSITLLATLLMWLIYGHFGPGSNTSTLIWMSNFFVGFPQLLPSNVVQFKGRFFILIAWVISAPCIILGIHSIATPLTSNPSRMLKVVVRKMYHIACVAAFLPVIVVLDETLMLSCALLAGLAILVLIEAVRVSGLPSQNLSKMINAFVERSARSSIYLSFFIDILY